METRRAAHPTAEVLKAFGLGKLDDSSSGVLMEHLDLCAACRQIVASQSGDDFLDRLRHVHNRSATPAPAKSFVGMEGKPKSPPGPNTLSNLPPELADNPQYDILRELGRGGMGVVYLAKNKLMDRLEVLKVINKALLDRPGAVERFLREIRAAAKLNHVNVVAAYSALQLGDLLVFAMEYVEGQDRAAVVKANGPLPLTHGCFYVQQAALGLQHAFEKKMIHRDIKPQNLILAREGRKHVVKVLDFGLAKVMREKTENTALTGEGNMLGTPDYMAPEQALDAATADIRADIYSLGCTLYFLLSGNRPFQCKNVIEVVLAHQSLEAPALNVARAEVPAELAAVVRKMMAKDRAQRYQTPLEVVQALGPFLKQGAKPKSPSVPVVKPAEASLPATQVETPPLSASPPSPAWDSLTESVLAAARPGKSEVIRKRPSGVAQSGSRKGWLLAGTLVVGLLLLGLLGYWLATVMLRVETPNGTLIVEMNDDESEARITNGKLILTGSDGKVRYTLTANDRRKQLQAGAYKIRVEGADGLVLDTPEFTIKKGGEVKVRVTMAERVVAKNTPASLAADRKAAEYVLSIGGIVRVNDEVDDTRAIADLPKEPFRLTYIDLIQNKKVRNASLAAFNGCKNLTFLDLRETQVKDAGLTHFKDCKNLTHIDLGGTQVSDAGLAHFKDCKNLTYLCLYTTQVGDKGLANFKDCKNLSHLNLSRTKLKDEGLTNFKNCKNLTHLDLGDTLVSNAGLANFKDCKNLEGLVLYMTQVSDADLAHFKDWKNLTYLHLLGTQVSDAGLAHLKDCKNLTNLILDRTQVSDAGLAHLKDRKHLTRLVLYQTKVTPAGVEALQKALPKCGIEWDKPAAALPPPSPPARKASLDPNRKPDDKGFVSLFNGKDLTGWKVDRGAADQWTVEGDTIRGQSKDWLKRNYLLTEKEYADFILRFDFKVEDGSHGGVAIRALEGEKLPHQGQLTFDHPLIKLTNPARDREEPTGATYWLKSAATNVRPAEILPLPTGMWHSMEVVVRGDNCTVTVGGKKLLNETLDAGAKNNGDFIPGLARRKGKVGFQINTGTVRYRNIEIKELPSSAPDFVSLFNGKDLTGWTTTNGKAADWTVKDGYVEVSPGRGHIRTKEAFGPNFQLHVEFWLPLMANKKGQGRANSGVFLQGRYEIQILDSYMNDTFPAGDVGALYRIIAPNMEARKKAIRKPETWNTLDITFHSPRVDEKGRITQPGRLTVILNDVAIINDAKFDRVSGESLDNQLGNPGPILLQDHGAKVRFRNLKIRDLPPTKKTSLDPDRKAAEYVLSIGGTIRVNGDERGLMSWLTQLLPYVEQQNLWRITQDAYQQSRIPWRNPPHIGLSTVIDTFACPADPRVASTQIAQREKFRVALTSYLGVEGQNALNLNGMLFHDSRIRMADVTDGTSQTLFAGERPPSTDFRYGWWYAGAGQRFTGSADMVLGVQEQNLLPVTKGSCPPGTYSYGPGSMNNQCDMFHFWSLHIGGAFFC